MYYVTVRIQKIPLYFGNGSRLTVIGGHIAKELNNRN